MTRLAVACLALLVQAAAHAGAMTGDLALAARLERKLTQDQLARQAAYVLAATATQDTDGYPLPPAQGTGAGPAGGGLIPSTSAAPKGDGFGAPLGYCAWDNGTITSHAGYITGVANIAAVTLAVVTPGADNLFQTTCADVSSGAGASGDDYVVAYTAGQILAGVQGNTYFADPVATTADLALLAPTALKDGQVRLVRATNALHRYDAGSGTWADLAGPWARSANDLFYTAGKVGVGTATPGRALSVHSAADVPVGLSSGGPRAGIDIVASGGSAVNAFLGYDSTGAGQVRLEARQSGASLALVTSGGSVSLSSAGVLTAGSVVASSLQSTGPITTAALQSTGNLAITATAVTVGGPTTFTGPVAANGGLSAAGASVTGTLTADTVAAGAMTVNGNLVWHAGNLSLSSYVAKTDLLGGGGLLTNTAVSSGGTALAANTSGNSNTAVGYQALQANTTGAENTAVGTGALRSSVSGFGNTAVGAVALPANTGTGNTAIGRAALLANTAGTGNTALGSGAGSKVTTGSFNLLVGGTAGTGITTGNNNILIGYSVGQGLATGTANIFIGQQAGFQAPAAMTGTVVLGRYETPTADNTVYLADGTGTLRAQFDSSSGLIVKGAISSAAAGVGLVLENSGTGTGTAARQVFRATGTDRVYVTGGQGTAAGDGLLSVAIRDGAAGTMLERMRVDLSGITTSGAVSAGSMTVNGYAVWHAGTLNLTGGGGITTNTALAASADALLSNTSGASNSAFGWGALRSNTTASNNTALGYAALRTTTTGHSNTAIGANALTALTTASGNVGVGITAGYLVTTGSNNVFIGNASGSSVTTGADNVYVGSQSGVSATTGVFNTAVGSNSLMTATSSLNTAVGFGALRAVTSGANNIGLGTNAGSAVTTGASNLLLGYLAGSGSGTPAGLTGTVVIGGYQTPTANQTIYLADGQGTLRAQLDAASGLQVKSTLLAGSPTTTLVLENGGATAGTAARQLFLAGGVQQVAVDGGMLNSVGDGYMSVSVRDSASSALVQRWRATATGGNLYGTWIATSGLEVTSDERLKKNVVALSGQEVLAKLLMLRPVEYQLIRDSSHQYGFLAQQVQPVLPHLVSQSPDTGYLALRYTELVPLLTAAVQDLAAHKLDNVVGKWITSSDKKERLLFEADGATVLRGHGDLALAIRNAQNDTVASVSRGGDLALAGGLQFVDSRRGGFAFNPTGTLVSSDTPGEIVVTSKDVPRAALRLQHAGTGDAAATARVYGYLFGDATGVGLADGGGNKLLSAGAANGHPTVTVHGSLSVGDGASSEIVLSAGTALRTQGDGALQIETARGVRVVNPATKETVIDLGADGSLKARRLRPTEVVDPYASCGGLEGSIARDARGQVVVCTN